MPQEFELDSDESLNCHEKLHCFKLRQMQKSNFVSSLSFISESASTHIDEEETSQEFVNRIMNVRRSSTFSDSFESSDYAEEVPQA